MRTIKLHALPKRLRKEVEKQLGGPKPKRKRKPSDPKKRRNRNGSGEKMPAVYGKKIVRVTENDCEK